MRETHYRNCNLCEAICGIEIRHEAGEIISIAGDKLDPFSKGHICPKAVALKDIYEDKNRLRKPIRKTHSGWMEIGWQEAFDEAAERILNIQKKYGRDAVAVYQGNPSVHNLGTMLNGRDLLKTLKTKNNYSATSVDQLPHHFAAWAMLGHPFLIPIPDIGNTGYFLILGANPLASNGSLMTAPGAKQKIAEIMKRGKVVVIDPRKTETAAFASEHFFIKPAADVYLLLAIINTLFAENLANPGRLLEFSDGIEDLQKAAEAFTPEISEMHTGIPASDIKRIAIEFGKAEKAVCYGRMGVSVQKFGGLCQWLINCINIITGNFDRPGGAMFTAPAFDILGMARPGENIFGRWQSRVRNLPEFMGELPVAALAEEIETEGDGQIKALITSCGNPALSTPNGTRLEAALEKLEFMLSIDIYLNETTRHADLILPPVTNLESSHYDIVFNMFAVKNTAKYSPPLFAKPEGTKHDWEIFQELNHRLNGNTAPFKPEPPEVKLGMGLQFGPYGLPLDKLKAEPHGIDLGELRPCLPKRLQTENKRIDIAPEIFLNALSDLKTETMQAESNGFTFRLIGRRHLLDCNSWLHNSPRLLRGKNRCTAMINTADAERLGLADNAPVKISSRTGTITLPCEITDAIAPGVVSIPHGYGHSREGIDLDTAKDHAGASINDLTDEMEIDELTGNAAFSNQKVRVEI